MTTETLSAADRVAAGTAWLDERVPHWWERVTLPEFNIADKCACVLGQVFRPDAEAYVDEHGDDLDPEPIMLADDFGTGTKLASGYAWAVDNEHLLSLERARELGFEAIYRPNDYYDDEDERSDYGQLQAAWREVINERQSA
jgi:hypothetical protein